jgi:hypothetical protein
MALVKALQREFKLWFLDSDTPLSVPDGSRNPTTAQIKEK